MYNLKLFHLYNRLSLLYLNREISTDTILMARHKREKKLAPFEPGMRRLQAIYQDDSKSLENLEEEDLDEELDVMNIDRSYNEHIGELKENKIRHQRGMTINRYFKEPYQPLTLTYNDMQCIKYLHEKDPDEWNPKTLSQSFPATEGIIKKVLKNKFKADPDKIKKRDAKVLENWKLLEEGKLKADPDFLEHLKKFTNRKEILLEQLKNEKFYLPEIKEEPVWNNREMANIITRYEKSIEKLANEQLKKLGSGIESNEKNHSTDTEKSYLEIVNEKINKAKPKNNVEEKESFVLREMLRSCKKYTTFENFEESLLNRANLNKHTDLVEKAILEYKLGVNRGKNVKNEAVVSKSSIAEPIKTPEYLHNEESSSIVPQNKTLRRRGNDVRLNKKFSEKESIVKVESTSEEKQYEAESQISPCMDEKHWKKFLKAGFLSDSIPAPDARTLFIMEEDIGKRLNPEKCQEEITQESEIVLEVKKEIPVRDPEREKRQNLYYNEEVKAIQNTSFWDSGNTSRDKILIENNKAPLQSPLETSSSVTKAQLTRHDTYPQRIKIPNDKKGSGLIFKVKDCYYDDDGEFLYRVPGMVG